MKIKTYLALSFVAALCACGGGGGGGDSVAKPTETCQNVTNTTGDIVDAKGVVTIKGASSTVNLCCSTGFQTNTTPDQAAAGGGVIKGNTATTCK